MVTIDNLPNSNVVSTEDLYAYDDADEGTASLITKKGRPGQLQITDTKGIDIILDDTAVDNDDTVNLLQVRDVTESVSDLLRFIILPQGKLEQYPVSPQVLGTSIITGLTSLIGFSYISQNRMYVSGNPCFQIFDIGIRDQPELVRTVTGIAGNTYALNNTTCLQVHRDFVMTTFLGDGGVTNNGGIALYDIDDENAVVVNAIVIEDQDTKFGLVPNLHTVFDFASWGDFNFYPDNFNDTITVIDVQNPLKPRVIAVLSDGDNGLVIDKPVAIDVSEGVLYWSNAGTLKPKGVYSARLTGLGSPELPEPRGFVNLAAGPEENQIGRLEARGSHVLAGAGNGLGVTGDSERFYSLDFDDIDNPTILNASNPILISDNVTQILFDENVAIVSSISGSSTNLVLTILDISDLRNMKIASSFDNTFKPFGIGIAQKGNEMYFIAVTFTGTELISIDLQGIKTQALMVAHADVGTLAATTKITTRRLEVTDNVDVGHGGLTALGPLSTASTLTSTPSITPVDGNTLPGDLELDLINDMQIINATLDQAGDVDIVMDPLIEIIPGHVILMNITIGSTGGVFVFNDARFVDIGPTSSLGTDESFFVRLTCFNANATDSIGLEIFEL